MRTPLGWLIGLAALGTLAVASPVAGAAVHTRTATHPQARGVANCADPLLAEAPIETMPIRCLPPTLPTRLRAVVTPSMVERATGLAMAATLDLHVNPFTPRTFTRRSATVIGVSGCVLSAVYDSLPLYVAADWNRLAQLLEEVPVTLPLYVAADWNRLAGLLEGC